MNREKVLKILLVSLGLLFLAAAYPIVMYLWWPGNEPPGDTMMLSLYFTLGIFPMRGFARKYLSSRLN